MKNGTERKMYINTVDACTRSKENAHVQKHNKSRCYLDSNCNNFHCHIFTLNLNYKYLFCFVLFCYVFNVILLWFAYVVHVADLVPRWWWWCGWWWWCMVSKPHCYQSQLKDRGVIEPKTAKLKSIKCAGCTIAHGWKFCEALLFISFLFCLNSLVPKPLNVSTRANTHIQSQYMQT